MVEWMSKYILPAITSDKKRGQMREGGLSKLIGKTIKSVVIDADNPGPPRDQIHLVFTDGTVFEFYGDSFSIGSAVTRRSEERVLRLSGLRGGQVTHLKTAASEDALERREEEPLGSGVLPNGTVIRLTLYDVTFTESVVNNPPRKPFIVK